MVTNENFLGPRVLQISFSKCMDCQAMNYYYILLSESKPLLITTSLSMRFKIVLMVAGGVFTLSKPLIVKVTMSWKLSWKLSINKIDKVLFWLKDQTKVKDVYDGLKDLIYSSTFLWLARSFKLQCFHTPKQRHIPNLGTETTGVVFPWQYVVGSKHISPW